MKCTYVGPPEIRMYSAKELKASQQKFTWQRRNIYIMYMSIIYTYNSCGIGKTINNFPLPFGKHNELKKRRKGVVKHVMWKNHKS